MSELSPQGGSEGYGACDDAARGHAEGRDAGHIQGRGGI